MKNSKYKTKENLKELDEIKLKSFKELESEEFNDIKLEDFKKSQLNEFHKELNDFKKYLDDSKITRSIESLKYEKNSDDVIKKLLKELESIGLNGKKSLKILEMLKSNEF